jgi:hypothetical protein
MLSGVTDEPADTYEVVVGHEHETISYVRCGHSDGAVRDRAHTKQQTRRDDHN